VSVALSAAHALGSPLLEAAASPRALVIGLGAGSMPLWLGAQLPSRLRCDVVELDPTVVAAAMGALGFPRHVVRDCQGLLAAATDLFISDSDRLAVYLCDGAEFVAELAAIASGEFGYDLVIVDAFDQSGTIPAALCTEPFLSHLKALLRPSGAVALNLLASTETSDGIAGIVGGFSDALGGDTFSVCTPPPETGSMVFGFTRCHVPRGVGESLQAALRQSGCAIDAAVAAHFSIADCLDVDFLEVPPQVSEDIFRSCASDESSADNDFGRRIDSAPPTAGRRWRQHQNRQQHRQ